MRELVARTEGHEFVAAILESGEDDEDGTSSHQVRTKIIEEKREEGTSCLRHFVDERTRGKRERERIMVRVMREGREEGC